jgi:hypothetical protein
MFLETIKANLLITIFFAALFVGGYWAVVSIQKSPEEFDRQEVDVSPIIVSEPIGSGGQTSSQASGVVETPVETPPQTPAEGQSSSSFSSLIGGLQKLVDDNVLMKSGSRGSRVGVVQEFLNIYTGVDARVDNDYGPGTETRVRNFQRENGLTADGQAGPNTYRKMIEWLNKQ